MSKMLSAFWGQLVTLKSHLATSAWAWYAQACHNAKYVIGFLGTAGDPKESRGLQGLALVNPGLPECHRCYRLSGDSWWPQGVTWAPRPGLGGSRVTWAPGLGLGEPRPARMSRMLSAFWGQLVTSKSHLASRAWPWWAQAWQNVKDVIGFLGTAGDPKESPVFHGLALVGAGLPECQGCYRLSGGSW